MRLLFDLSLLTAVFTDISVCILILNYVTYGSLLGLQHIGDVGVITGRKAMFRKLFGIVILSILRGKFYFVNIKNSLTTYKGFYAYIFVT